MLVQLCEGIFHLCPLLFELDVFGDIRALIVACDTNFEWEHVDCQPTVRYLNEIALFARSRRVVVLALLFVQDLSK